MAVNYTAKAQVIDIRNDAPRQSDSFLIDTNVWFWIAYSKGGGYGLSRISNYANYVSKSHREPIDSTESAEAGREVLELLPPGRYHIDDNSSDPLPSGHTSRRWGVGIKRGDWTVTIDRDPWSSVPSAACDGGSAAPH